MTQSSKTSGATGGTPTPPTILLVDDIPENLQILAEMLLQTGYSPRPVTSGVAALRLLEKVAVDLVLLDINMPEMDGFELCSRLKADARFRDIPVIFLSAADDSAHKVDAFRLGGVDYITKPFHFEEVRARVDTHLRLRRLLNEQQVLLERTLQGAVNTLADCLELSSPHVFARSRLVRDCVSFLVDHIDSDEDWSIRIAGSLCLLGCVALPDDVTKAVLTGNQRDRHMLLAYQRHAQVGAEILLDIPRLERVSMMIGAQYDDALAGSDAHVLLGARVLRVAQRFAQVYVDGKAGDAIPVLRHEFPWASAWLPKLHAFKPTPPDMTPQQGRIGRLPVGARMLEEVRTKDGRLLLAPGKEVTKVMWQRLAEFVGSDRLEDHFVYQRVMADLGSKG